ncbi:UPF0481 protein [Prunus yedoensis var. nudiflora]|uniref:UPF0481 protein n=1 Tax=Prunus yedoensis var. nudiflora TaxID=2094558 RepID=A0A314XNE0_PRUYE|nr:UPF0481 protein [Prunus yedoensis var. nudiflora]
MAGNAGESSRNHTCVGIIDYHGDSSSNSSIFKVPQVLRRQKEAAYTPDVVSIGPYHGTGGEQFEPMEKVKRRYLQELLSHMKIDLETLIGFVIKSSVIGKEGTVEFEKRARAFYAEPLEHLSSKCFVEMMVLDACFMIQLFRKSLNGQSKKDISDPSDIDPVFGVPCMFQYVCHDLLLLENQIPWFVIESIYNVTVDKYPGIYPAPLPRLVLVSLSTLRPLHHSCNSYISKIDSGDKDNGVDKILHILHLIRTSIVFPLKGKSKGHHLKLHVMHRATALSKAGIKFKRTKPAQSIMMMNFEKGDFTIPQLAIGELTESLFRNLIALEQCYHAYWNEITSYAILMDKLIITSEDMRVLCEAGVIANWLSAEDGTKFFNNLYNGTWLETFYYGELCDKVNKYYDEEWNVWWELLKREKLSSPWKIISLILAIILLGLTLWQTVYNIDDHM